MSSSLEQVTEAIRAGIGNFIPEDAGALDVFFEEFPSVFGELRQSLDTFAETLEGRDISERVIDSLRQMGADSGQLEEAASETAQEYATVYAFWRQR
jgi:methyl-accepting chemotaxis protein